MSVKSSSCWDYEGGSSQQRSELNNGEEIESLGLSPSLTKPSAYLLRTESSSSDVTRKDSRLKGRQNFMIEKMMERPDSLCEFSCN